MSEELCCACDAPTGRAGAHEDSLYAGRYGPYCEDCWHEAPDQLAHRIEALEARLAEVVEALTFYADLPAEWTIDPKGRSSDVRYGDLHLLGEKARAALTLCARVVACRARLDAAIKEAEG